MFYFRVEAAVVRRLPHPLSDWVQQPFVRYVVGGGLAASVHLAVVAALVELFGVGVENANSVAFVIGVLINYAFQRSVTFRDQARDHGQQMPLFIGFALIGLGINRFVYSHGIEDLHLQYLIAAAFAIAVVFVFNFTANSLVTFRRQRSGRARA